MRRLPLVTLFSVLGLAGLANSRGLDGCPEQCSCTLQRSYHSITGRFDQVDVLCNRYAAKFNADLSKAPDISELRAGDRNIKLTIEQLGFEKLFVGLFGQQRLIELRLLHNPKLKSVDPKIFRRFKNSLVTFMLLDHDALETFPLRALSEDYKLRSLTIQLKSPLKKSEQLSVKKLLHLRSLSLYGGHFAPMLPDIAGLKNLTQLTLNNMTISDQNFPKSLLPNLPLLANLNLASNDLRSLPKEISEARNLKLLSLENNNFHFSGMGQPFFDFVPNSLQILNLRSNRMKSVPCETFKLPNLRYLKLSSKILCLKCEEDSELIERLNRTCGAPQDWFFPDEPQTTTVVPFTTAVYARPSTTIVPSTAVVYARPRVISTTTRRSTTTEILRKIHKEVFYEYTDVINYDEGSGQDQNRMIHILHWHFAGSSTKSIIENFKGQCNPKKRYRA